MDIPLALGQGWQAQQNQPLPFLSSERKDAWMGGRLRVSAGVKWCQDPRGSTEMPCYVPGLGHTVPSTTQAQCTIPLLLRKHRLKVKGP